MLLFVIWILSMKRKQLRHASWLLPYMRFGWHFLRALRPNRYSNFVGYGPNHTIYYARYGEMALANMPITSVPIYQ